ncbi:MAG TPA: alcohol dehydrogenase catalytic domain-containing protein [Candidatus Limnocylindrales bacterium]|nr:alcohol dehydrogenase catalytic domain-containing protein [Candidatus Limnocylindrales bacterium]
MREIQAAVIERAGVPTVIETLQLDDEPRPGEVLVRMMASGVCHSDLHVRDGEWQRPGPIVMGHEGAGIIEAVGPGIDEAAIGARVALTWYAPCLRCRECQRGRQWLCKGSPSLGHAMADGTTRTTRGDGTPVRTYLSIGTMATHQVVPASAVVPMPEGVPHEVAALIGCGVSTGVGAVLKTAEVPPGSTVAVIGLGGVGLSCVMGAALANAGRIVVVDTNRAKIDLAGTLGATHWVHADPGNPLRTVEGIREAAGEGGPDFVFEAIGLPVTIEQAIAALPPGGTAVLVGMTAFGQTARFEGFPFVDGARRIIGSNYGSAVAAIDFPRYARWFLEGKLPVDRLIDRRLPLEDLEDAFDRLRAGQAARQVVVFGDEGSPDARSREPGEPAP